jgi:hypothetical protein
MHPEALRALLKTSEEHFQLEELVVDINQGISTDALPVTHICRHKMPKLAGNL